ncbi:inositol monophosphatase 2-like isoform X1 [Zootermopsis nevadensis]|uniref:Inositol-1-monophosphatase n=1 Tax=Zootermopsis nevadensis TaxID=136037 RepID=A0A067RG75_ZOONE|nr:inositol monophosphatase 2-like isoform X1 [Zootermopsis nevadensis]KDR22876.1 Inositol monophosphatase 2 [Zootermopsis nevadensis]
MKHDVDQYFETVLGITRDAGKIIKEGIARTKNVDTKLGSWDLVTQYDRRVENVLMKEISKKFPSHKFIAEETNAEQKATPELTNAPTWIIDPIDGTTNFVHGFHLTCISIALSIEKEVVIGIIYNPILDQLFTAIKGQGAHLNNQRINASQVEELCKSMVCLESSFACIPSLKDSIMKRTEACVKVAHGIRVLGSAALALCYVAMGVAEAYHIDGLQCWDVAAGALIVREAGGIVLDSTGGTFDMMSHRILACGTKKLAEELVILFKKADASIIKININNG